MNEKSDRALGHFFQERVMARALRHERTTDSPWSHFKKQFETDFRSALELRAKTDETTKDYLALFDSTDVPEEESLEDVLDEWLHYASDIRRAESVDQETEMLLSHLEQLVNETKTRMDTENRAAWAETLRKGGTQRNFSPTQHMELDEELAAALHINGAMLSSSAHAELAQLLQEKNDKEFERLCELGEDYGAQGVRSGLALHAAGFEIGEFIDHTRDRVGESLTRAAIAQHNELLDIADTEIGHIQSELFEPGKEVAFDAQTVRSCLLSRAAAYLQQLQDRSPEDLRTDFQRLRADLVLFATVFKDVMKRNEQVGFQEWKGLGIESIVLQELDPTVRERLLEECKEMVMMNWKDKGVPAMETALHGLQEGFAEKLEPTRFHMLKRNEVLVAFIRFDERSDMGPNALYAGSFNVNPAMIGSAIGSAFFHEVLNAEAKDHVVHAHVLADDAVGSKYVEEFGFVITGVETDTDSRGESVEWFMIRRDAAINKEATLPIQRFAFPAQRAEMIQWVREQTAQGKTITSYRRVMDGANETRILS